MQSKTLIIAKQIVFANAQHYAGPPGLDEPQSSSNSGLVAGTVVTVLALVLAAVCIAVMIIWWRYILIC